MLMHLNTVNDGQMSSAIFVAIIATPSSCENRRRFLFFGVGFVEFSAKMSFWSKLAQMVPHW